MDAMMMNSENIKTSDTHRPLLNKNKLKKKL